MAKGNFTGTGASALLVAADVHRDTLVIQHTNTVVAALGIDEAAVAGEGLQLQNLGDNVTLTDWRARSAIYIIGNGATGTYQG